MTSPQMVLFCPNLPACKGLGGWGSHVNSLGHNGKTFIHLPDTELIRLCHSCGFQWPESEDWKYFRLVVRMESPEAYKKAWNGLHGDPVTILVVFRLADGFPEV